MKPILKMYLLDVENETASELDVLDDIHAFYRLLNCRCIDIVERTVAGRSFTFIVDDEGLLKDNPKISALDSAEWEPMLVGNLLICHTDFESGELTALSDDDVIYLKSHIHTIPTRQYPDGYPMLLSIDYA